MSSLLVLARVCPSGRTRHSGTFTQVLFLRASVLSHACTPSRAQGDRRRCLGLGVRAGGTAARLQQELVSGVLALPPSSIADLELNATSQRVARRARRQFLEFWPLDRVAHHVSHVDRVGACLCGRLRGQGGYCPPDWDGCARIVRRVGRGRVPRSLSPGARGGGPRGAGKSARRTAEKAGAKMGGEMVRRWWAGRCGRGSSLAAGAGAGLGTGRCACASAGTKVLLPSGGGGSAHRCARFFVILSRERRVVIIGVVCL
ncbi:hypothetical protein BC628DRAFT_1078892 [Trametes gibbosa]|nr:hypothetical protein BC628DRAFT_1078892 [Trametes gibbosa]